MADKSEGWDREEFRGRLTCVGQWWLPEGCAEKPKWVVEWRPDCYDPFLTGQDGYRATNACAEHLGDLVALVEQDWDGHVHLMSVDFYLVAWTAKREAMPNERLGMGWWR